MACVQQPSNPSITFGGNQDPLKINEPLPPLRTIPPIEKVNAPNGLRGGDVCFDCLACLCCCCALEECCCECCQDL